MLHDYRAQKITWFNCAWTNKWFTIGIFKADEYDQDNKKKMEW